MTTAEWLVSSILPILFLTLLTAVVLVRRSNRKDRQ